MPHPGARSYVSVWRADARSSSGSTVPARRLAPSVVEARRGRFGPGTSLGPEPNPAHAERARPAFAVVNEVVARLGDARLIFAYYTRERLQSDAARCRWVEPDLQPLDF